MIDFVHAVIKVEGRYALQLRDSTVRDYPLRWAFFGGSVGPRETAMQALNREIREELELEMGLVDAKPLATIGHWQFYRKAFTLHEWATHRLHEGLAVGLFDLTEALSLDSAPITKAVLWADVQIEDFN